MEIQMEAQARAPEPSAAPDQQQIRILIADEQRLFRESLAEALRAEAAFEVVGLAANGTEALELIRALQPDIVLLEVTMAWMSGIEALRLIKAETPRTRVIFLTMLTSDDAIIEALAAGVSGYVLKDISATGLVATIRAVYNGEQVTAPIVTTRIAEIAGKRSFGRSHGDDGLTARETEVLLLIAQGRVAKEVARLLAISEKTVRNHISGIYRKLDMYDRAHVIIYALKKGLIDIHMP